MTSATATVARSAAVGRCSSSYLAFRHVPAGDAFRPGWPLPDTPGPSPPPLVVGDGDGLVLALRLLLARYVEPGRAGLLLGGGTASAILAALLPPGTLAYTLTFPEAGDGDDDRERAELFARARRLRHRLVPVTWRHHLEDLEPLMRHKRAPLQAIEVAVHRAARAAHDDGVELLVTGFGADARLGGLAPHLARASDLDAFATAYAALDPELVLGEPCPVRPLFERYRKGAGIDAGSFLAEVHNPGLLQAAENAAGAAHLTVLAPFDYLVPATPLDPGRVRTEGKYLLRDAFRRLHPDLEPPPGRPFLPPVGPWLRGWPGPRRGEFRPDLDLAHIGGEERFLVYCLERFLRLLEADEP